MARRVTYLNDIWSEGNPVLYLDAGSMFGSGKLREREQTRFLCLQSQALGLDAIGLGPTDLSFGLGFLQGMIDTYELPFTNANLHRVGSRESILPSHLLIERGGLTFAICSVIDPASEIFEYYTRRERILVADPVVVLSKLVPDLRSRADVVILLSQLGRSGTNSLLQEVAGIDVAVIGGTQLSMQSERLVNSTWLLCAVHEGRTVGRSDLSLAADGTVRVTGVKVQNLGAAITDDPVMLEKVEQFNTMLERIGPPAPGGR